MWLVRQCIFLSPSDSAENKPTKFHQNEKIQCYILPKYYKRKITQSPKCNKNSNTSRKKTSVCGGESFLRITNATLEFVGSSNTVKQKRLLRPTSVLGSWKSIYIFPLKSMDKSRPGPADSSLESQTHTRWHFHAFSKASSHWHKQD